MVGNDTKITDDPTFDDRDPKKNYTMKYVGVTFGKIGILSQKVPLESGPKIEKVKYKAPKPPKKRISQESLEPPPKPVKKPVPVMKAKPKPKPVPKLKVSKFKSDPVPEPEPEPQPESPIKPEVVEESTFKTPPKDLKSEESLLGSPLQGRVTRPNEGDNGSPRFINFDFDTLDNQSYFGRNKGAKLNQNSLTHHSGSPISPNMVAKMNKMSPKMKVANSPVKKLDQKSDKSKKEKPQKLIKK